MTNKQLVIMEFNKRFGGNGAEVYNLLQVVVDMALARFKDERISKTQAEKIYGVALIRELEATVPSDELYYRTSGAVNSKKFYSRVAIEAAIAKMGYPMGEDPLRRKRARYTRKKKESA